MESVLHVLLNGDKHKIALKAGHQMFRRVRINNQMDITYIQLPTHTVATKAKGRGLIITPPKNTEFTFTHVSDFVKEQAYYNAHIGMTSYAPPSAIVEDVEVEEVEEQPEQAPEVNDKMTDKQMVNYIKEALEREEKVKEILEALDISRGKYYKLKAQIDG